MSKPWKIVVATGNAHKLKEISAIFQRQKINQVEFIGRNQIATLQNLNIAETGHTFYENALLKCRQTYAACIASYAHSLDGRFLGTMADDSGLVVPDLNGAPGVHSSRYSKIGDDKHNCLKLTNAIKEKTPSNHKHSSFSLPAYFHCCTIFYSERERNKNTIIFAEGQLHGKVIARPRGENGFGYDPLFIPTPSKFTPEKTLAEISEKEKNSISHRALSLRELGQKLNAFLTNLSVL